MSQRRWAKDSLVVSRVEKLLVKLALQSRLAVLILQTLSAAFLPRHISDAFQPRLPKANVGFLTPLLTGFRQWDSAHFLQISYGGYTHEGSLAFFPLFPLVTRYLAFAFDSFLPIPDAILLSGVILNFIGFLCVVVLLFRLSLVLFKVSFLPGLTR